MGADQRNHLFALGLQGGWGEHSPGCTFHIAWWVASRRRVWASTEGTRGKLKDASKIGPRSFHVRHKTVFVFRNWQRSLLHTCFNVTSKTQSCTNSCTRLSRYPFPSEERTPSTNLKPSTSKPWPESCLDCLICAIFARQWGTGGRGDGACKAMDQADRLRAIRVACAAR